MVSGVAPKNGDVQAILVELANHGQELPGPINGFLLEVVSKGPVTQHFKEGMVVGVDAHFFEVVVLPAHAKALLAVGNPRMKHGFSAHKNVFKRIHSRIGKHQRRIVLDDKRRRGQYYVTLGLKKVQECLAEV